ncbi:MAG: ABC transporter permease [Clostridiales bacterium]|nr:ABC transporter permease [Clostridiales bacterium]
MYMVKYVLKRIGLMLLTFSIIMVTCFVLIKLLPIPLGEGLGVDKELVEMNLRARGYFDPIPVQMWNYVVRIFRDGDFGIGTTMPGYINKPVWDGFVSRLPPTVLINVYSSLIGVPIGLGLGILAALKKNKWQDQVISTGVIVMIAVPSVVYAFLIQYVFCFKLGWFPLRMESGTDYFSWPMFRSMIPAVFSLCFGSIAGYARYTRAELTEVLTGEFMLLARTKGLTHGQAILRHAMRNAMVPIFPMILGEFISVLSGSMIIESIFDIPGVGGLYLKAITVLDYDFFMLLSGFYTLIGLAAGIIIDISYGFIDPRIRMGAK